MQRWLTAAALALASMIFACSPAWAGTVSGVPGTLDVTPVLSASAPPQVIRLDPTAPPVSVGIGYSNDFGAVAPSGNAVSGFSPDPGGNLVSGVPYSPTGVDAGCAVLKASFGTLSASPGALVTGMTNGHTYYLLTLDAQAAPANGTTIVDGTSTGQIPGNIWPPIPIPANGYIAPGPELIFPIAYYNGLTICIQDGASFKTYGVPSPAIPAAGVTLLGLHL